MRGQFRGYREEPGVSPNSDVETFAALRLEIDSWRWAGVPFLIRAGKRLPIDRDRSFREAAQASAGKMGGDGRNYFRFRLGPDIELSLGGAREASRSADGADAGRAVGGEVHHQRRDGRLSSGCSPTP